MRTLRRRFVLLVSLAVASCGGASSGDPPADSAELIADACDKIVSLNCSDLTTTQCTNSLNEELDDSLRSGCGAEFNAIAACYSEKLTSCDQHGDEVCPTEFAALDACEDDGTDECSVGAGGAGPGAPPYYQKCMIGCSGWAAKCETLSSPTVECSCTNGSKVGTTFTIQDCNDLTSSTAAPYCAG